VSTSIWHVCCLCASQRRRRCGSAAPVAFDFRSRRSGSLLSKADVEQILGHPTWNGVVVLDEAYIDFTDDDASLAGLVMEYANLIVLHTLSEAFGVAGIRLGAAYAPVPSSSLLQNLSTPWSIPSPSSVPARYAVSEEGLSVMRQNRTKVKA
jgi:histidinol-phosphate aminotransferase